MESGINPIVLVKGKENNVRKHAYIIVIYIYDRAASTLTNSCTAGGAIIPHLLH